MTKVIVTGGLGYIGKSTISLLEKQGHTCVVVDKVLGQHTHNPITLGWTFIRHNPVAVVHLSAKKSIGESIKKPITYYFNNLMSTLCVTFWCAVLNKPLVFASSAAVYEPNNPYAKAKVIEEKIVKLLPKSVILRYFNIGGQSNGAIDLASVNIFGVINRAVAGNTPFTVNDPVSTRDYTHVEDVAWANVCAVNHLLSGGGSVLTDVYTGEQHTVLEILEQYDAHGVAPLILYGNKKDSTIYPTVKETAQIEWVPTQTFNKIIQSEIEGLINELGTKSHL
jgi:UDP-glucose 4-epimerase